MSRSPSISERAPRPAYGLHFALTTLLTVVMLCAMTVYYGFHDLRNTAHDIAGAVLKSATAQSAAGATPTTMVGLALKEFRDAQQIEVCANGQCAVHGAIDAGLPLSADFLNAMGWPCASSGEGGLRATVCMSIDDVVADISRDVVMLLIAQGIGFGIWIAATRRFVARRKIWNDRVARASSTDAATGVLNRASFKAALDQAASRGDEGWLVLAGVDELQAVNELHGSAMGDQVILTVAERLKGFGEQIQTLGRTGGDEFAFIVRGGDPVSLDRALGRLRSAMTVPIDHHGVLLSATISAGAVNLERHLHAAELLRRANVALRTAKKVGADSQSIFSITFDIEQRKAHQLRLDLMNAVDKGHLELVYQPIVDSKGQVVVAEALARWNHPQLGFISPECFIAAAESSGLIHQLGISLLKKACDDLVSARQRGLPLKRMAVNVSPAQLNNPDLRDIVLSVVRNAGLEPADIELELTESAAMASRHDATQQLRELADAGFAISIDDFGTGYSSLSRLQTLPISKLKIDRSFVTAYDDPSGAVLLEAMIDLARRLKLSCVSEGIETPEQMAWLRERGCDLFQGYLIGKPMSIDQLVGLGFRVPLHEGRGGLIAAQATASAGAGGQTATMRA